MKELTLALTSLIALSGCISASPIISEPELQRLGDNGERHNEAVKNFVSNQVLLNIVRAQYHDLRRYTAVSDVTMNPGGSYERGAAIAGPGLGNNIGDPWTTLSGNLKTSNNDKLSYTFATATNSNDKDFSEVRYTAETLNEFWSQSWPRSLLVEVFFQEEALKIVDDHNVFQALSGYYADNGNGNRPRRRGAFFVMSDHGVLSYCLDSILACIEHKSTNEDITLLKKNHTSSVLTKMLANSSSDTTEKSTEKTSNNKSTLSLSKTYTWSGNPGAQITGDRIRDSYAEPVELSEAFTVWDKDKYRRPAKFELIYCSAYKKHKVVTQQGYGETPLIEPRDVSVFKCSIDLSQVDKTSALPYFLIMEGDHQGIYRPTLNTFDETTYLLGRALRTKQKESKKTEQSFCNPNFPNREKCEISKDVFKVFTKDDPKFKKCEQNFLARSKYKGAVFYAGLPELGDSEDIDCVDESSLTSSTIILLAKIAEYSVKKPQNNTQLLVTQ